jgi:hypothetical protein
MAVLPTRLRVVTYFCGLCRFIDYDARLLSLINVKMNELIKSALDAHTLRITIS